MLDVYNKERIDI